MLCAVVKETVLCVLGPCLQVAELTKTWAGKWKDMQQIIEVSGERGRKREEVLLPCGSEEGHDAYVCLCLLLLCGAGERAGTSQ